MASSSGTSSGSTQLPNSGSEEELRALMDRRRAKRMLSNRESARRSRMRKQRHLDDLTAQIGHLRKENAQVHAALNVTTHGYAAVDAENSVLRTQVAELSSRLQSLNQILCCMNSNASALGAFESFDGGFDALDGYPSPWGAMSAPLAATQAVMASPEMFQYC